MKNIYRKLELAIYEISKDILNTDIGDNIETIAFYSENLNMSLGTVQKAIQYLNDNNIIQTQKKGKLGTVLNFIDYKKILEVLKLKYLLCVMPITYSQRYKKIMNNIDENLKTPIPLYFSHMRGGYIRLKLIEESVYHFGVTSKLAALKAISSGMNLEIIQSFGPKTYVTKHVILKNRNNIINKIGIDIESNDHIFLTNFNFQKNENLKFIEIKYSEVIEKLLDHTIDAAIWNYDDVLDKQSYLNQNGIIIEDLNDNAENLLATESVIVINKNNNIIKNMFKIFFDKENFKLIDEEEEK